MTDPRDLIKAATPLPWHLDDDGTIYSDRAEVGYADVHDVQLIVYSVNNLPALLDVAEALRRLLDAIGEGGGVQRDAEAMAYAALARLENQP